jgi:hypothetical protein
MSTTGFINRTFALDAWSAQKAAVGISAVALFFAAAEAVCHALLRPTIGRRLSRGNAKLAREPKRLRAKVTSAVTKIVGNIHNCVAVPVALAVLLSPRVGGAAVGTARIHAASPLSLFMCVFSSGYFTYEILEVLMRFSENGPAFLVHAVSCWFVYFFACFRYVLHWHGAGFLLWEASTPLVHLRWFLYESGQASSRFYAATGLAMAVVFFAARNVWGPLLSLAFFRDTAQELALAAQGRSDFSPLAIYAYRAANVALNLLNAFWFSKIAQGLVAIFLGGKKKKGGGGGKEAAANGGGSVAAANREKKHT